MKYVAVYNFTYFSLRHKNVSCQISLSSEKSRILFILMEVGVIKIIDCKITVVTILPKMLIE